MKESYKVTHHESSGYISVKMIGFMNNEDYVNCWSEVLRQISRHQVNKILVDMSEAKIISESNLKWLHDVYFPRAYEIFNFYKVARVSSSDLFNQFSINKLDKDRKKAHYEELSKDFTDYTAAEKWLIS